MEKSQYPWVIREKEAKKLVNDYVETFCNSSSLWVDAVSGKYQLPLWRYVRAVASIQAKMITGCKVGWSKSNIMGVNFELDDKQLWGFMKRQKNQADRGFIDVSIPTGKLEEWSNGKS